MNDLPNEMILDIIDKMNKIDVLYSLVDVNERFNQLIFNPLYINELDLTQKGFLDCVFPLESKILERICKRILPRIHNKITKLIIEPFSMERIFHAGEYSQLSSLSLFYFKQETLVQNLKGETTLRYFLSEQIKCLNIDIEDTFNIEYLERSEMNIFVLILSICKHLNDLTFNQWFIDQTRTISIAHLPSTSCVSLILTKLNMSVNTFNDCLFLLDGRFPSLSIFMIDIADIDDESFNIDQTVSERQFFIQIFFFFR